jgi:site-specific recombinase XerD
MPKLKIKDLRLVRVADEKRRAAIKPVIQLWSTATTGTSINRRDEMLKKKCLVVGAFFDWIKKSPGEVTQQDVQDWQIYLHKEQKLKAATIYNRISLLSSFYRWAMRDSKIGSLIISNPVILARPKAPKPYQTDASKSLTDEEIEALVDVVRQRAETGDIVGKRDYAILLLYLATGMRRNEVISLRGKDLRITDDGIVLGGRVKGGHYRAREVNDMEVKAAVEDYLRISKRLHALKTDAPVWTRHDRGGSPGEQLSSHSFVKNLKQYAHEAGIDHIHLHQTRHTFARIVAEETGSITATQDALDHSNIAVTSVYVRRISLKRDLHSEKIRKRIKRKEGNP